MRFFLFPLIFFAFACGKSDPAPADTDPETDQTGQVIDPATLPRNPGCGFLSDDKLAEIVTGDAEGADISTLPGPTVSACYYRLENEEWSGDFVLAMADGGDADKIIRQVEAATAAERIRIGERDGQLLPGNRIMRVHASPPFELKLSILPKAGYAEFADETDRKRILTEIAEHLLER